MTRPYSPDRFFRPNFVLAVGVTAFLLNACSQQDGQQMQMPPSPVTVATVQPSTATYQMDYPGRIHGATEVEVRARVTGILQARLYQEGSHVEAGQALFRIEPEPYQDTVNAARAELASAESQLLRAEREWERVSGLYERNAVSARERDLALADHRAAIAREEAAQSSLSNAERQLRYTRVEAPVSGLTSMEALTEGNLVQAGTLLTHIVQHDPVQLYFTLPESDMEAFGAQIQPQVQLVKRDGSLYQHAGRLDFSDRRIDPATGTIQMRASFPNPENALIPGQFARVRVTLASYEAAILIDPTAVGQSPAGSRVFVVGPDNSARSQPVVLGPLIQGRQLILSGLEPGNRLVINGQVSLRDGAPVRIVNAANQEG